MPRVSIGGTSLALLLVTVGATRDVRAQAELAPKHAKALEDLRSEWARAQARIAELKARVDSLESRLVELGRLSEVQGYDSSEAKTERAALNQLDRDLGLVAEEARSVKAVRAMIEWFAKGALAAEGVEPTKCFATNGKFTATKACAAYLSNRCGLTYAQWGQLKGRVIKDNWMVEGRDLEEEGDFYDYSRRRGQPGLLDSVHFSFCHAVATSGHSFDFGWAWLPNAASWYYETFWPYGSADEFENSCKGRSYGSEAISIEFAAKPLAKEFTKETLLGWAAAARDRAKQCQKAVAVRCDDVYFIRDEPILSYITVSCRSREVSRSDVGRDLASFDTDAERLQHSTMIDRMNWCAAARTSGFSWRFQKPTLKGCVPRRE